MLPIINPNFETKELFLTEEEYHKRTDAVHSSSFKNILTSPYAYKFFLEKGITETPQIRLGRLAHKATLEGREFLNDYIVEPVFKGFTKDGVETTSANALSVKQAKAEWYSQLLPHQKVVSQADFDKTSFMLDSILRNKTVSALFKNGKTEVRGQFKHDATDLGVCFANDFLSFDIDIWADLKTCQDSTPYGFQRSVEKLHWDLQAAIYLIGTERVFGKRPKMPFWIAVQNTPPYECEIHPVNYQYIDTATNLFNQNMVLLENYLKSGHFPTSQEIRTKEEELIPSSFYIKKYNPEVI